MGICSLDALRKGADMRSAPGSGTQRPRDRNMTSHFPDPGVFRSMWDLGIKFTHNRLMTIQSGGLAQVVTKSNSGSREDDMALN